MISSVSYTLKTPALAEVFLRRLHELQGHVACVSECKQRFGQSFEPVRRPHVLGSCEASTAVGSVSYDSGFSRSVCDGRRGDCGLTDPPEQFPFDEVQMFDDVEHRPPVFSGRSGGRALIETFHERHDFVAAGG
jgi:hypothetical protein